MDDRLRRTPARESRGFLIMKRLSADRRLQSCALDSKTRRAVRLNLTAHWNNFQPKVEERLERGVRFSFGKALEPTDGKGSCIYLDSPRGRKPGFLSYPCLSVSIRGFPFLDGRIQGERSVKRRRVLQFMTFRQESCRATG
jgi:hypothetical protein